MWCRLPPLMYSPLILTDYAEEVAGAGSQYEQIDTRMGWNLFYRCWRSLVVLAADVHLNENLQDISVGFQGCSHVEGMKVFPFYASFVFLYECVCVCVLFVCRSDLFLFVCLLF